MSAEARLSEALEAFDGKRVEALEAIVEGLPATPALMQQLCRLANSEDARLQIGSTWLLRRYLQLGAVLTARQSEMALQVLLGDACWEARLHVLQMLGDVRIPVAWRGELWAALEGQSGDSNKFIRAWSYHGMAALAEQDADYRARALVLLAEGEGDEGASVRARVRRIRREFAWLRG